MRLKKTLTALTALTIVLSGAVAAAPAQAASSDRVVWTDPTTASHDAWYTRAITLRHNGAANGTVLGTFERYTNVDADRPAFPIYRSRDFGGTWEKLSDIVDTQFRVGNRYQPAFYELPEASGDLPKGTVLLVGSAIPNDLSSTRLVMYKSLDAGVSWSFVSTIDLGGPAIYDPGAGANTTAIWEPEVQLTDRGLVVYYSDERQKSAGVLQALVHKVSTDGGRTWGPIVNDVAVPDRNARPGMISVVKLPNGKYFGAWEVVNLPGTPVYGKFSDDGVNWGDPANLGVRLQTSSGQFLSGSPTVDWTPTGGPNGTLVVTGGSTTGATPGTSNFLANTNLGQGAWSLFPTPVDIGRGGYAQSVVFSLDNRSLMQFTSRVIGNNRSEVVSAVMPLDTAKLEAETQTLTPDVQVLDRSAASGGREVGFINQPSSAVTFTTNAPRAGTYQIRARFSNGSGAEASHQVAVNGGTPVRVAYPRTRDWDAYDYVTFPVTLRQGDNTIRFGKGDGFAELDVLEQYTVSKRYEAETATITNARVVTKPSASNGAHVGFIDTADSSVAFSSVTSDATATLAVRVFYSNGTGAPASHSLSVNGAAPITVQLPPTAGWDTESSVLVLVPLQAGNNTLRFSKNVGFAELDAIDVY